MTTVAVNTMVKVAELRKTFESVYVDMGQAPSTTGDAVVSDQIPTIHVSMAETALTVQDGAVFPLMCGEETVTVKVPETELETTLSFDSEAGVLDVIGKDIRIHVRAVVSDWVAGEDVLSLPSGNETESVCSVSRKITDSAGVSVVAVYTKDSGIEESVVRQLVYDISNSAGVSNAEWDVTVEGNRIQPGILKSMTLTGDVFAVTDSDGDLYASFAPFSETLAYAGFEETVSLDNGTKFLKGEYTDTEEELTLYIWETEAGNLKVLAKDDDAVKGLFNGTAAIETAPVDDTGEADEQDTATAENVQGPDTQDDEA